MFMLEIAGVKILYTGTHLYTIQYTSRYFIIQILSSKEIICLTNVILGDFSREVDRHLMSAEIPSVRPDVLIGIQVYSS